jgi:hypothetical protein
MHLTLDILRYLCDKKIIFKGRKDMLHLSLRYSERTVGQMLYDLDNAGRNSGTMEILNGVHKNASFARLWEAISGANECDEVMKTPVSKILGIANKAK